MKMNKIKLKKKIVPGYKILKKKKIIMNKSYRTPTKSQMTGCIQLANCTIQPQNVHKIKMISYIQ